MQSQFTEKTDLSEYFALTGRRPQNFVKDDHIDERFKNHPKNAKIIELKNKFIAKRNHDPIGLQVDLKQFDLSQLGDFDVIMVDPPWKEYQTRAEYFNINKPSEKTSAWTLKELVDLRVNKILTPRSFVFLWAGSEHLDDARALFKSWGLKRCDDIVWIKSNIQSNPFNYTQQDSTSFLKRCKEHCLVGLNENSDNKNDPDYIHPNIDSDVILTEEKAFNDFDKPEDIYNVIERFCLGRRRLMLFGNNRCLRKGWLVVGKDLTMSNYNKETYDGFFQGSVNIEGPQGGRLLGTTDEIEMIRPKSPTKT